MSALPAKADIVKQCWDVRSVSLSAAMERSARLVAVLLLRHGRRVINKFREDRYRLFVGTIEPINTYAVVGVGVLRDLEHISRSAVVKFHGQRIRRKDVIGDVTAPLSGDVLISPRVGDVCRTSRKQNCNCYGPRIFHETLELVGARGRRDSITSQTAW